MQKTIFYKELYRATVQSMMFSFEKVNISMAARVFKGVHLQKMSLLMYATVCKHGEENEKLTGKMM